MCELTDFESVQKRWKGILIFPADPITTLGLYNCEKGRPRGPYTILKPQDLEISDFYVVLNVRNVMQRMLKLQSW